MGRRTVSIGNQGFEDIRKENSFYVDKTNLIKEWWESRDIITLITRPRRFGKTLNMSMLRCFFSNDYANRSDLFQGLSIWTEEKYQALQGTYPLIFMSFADVKEMNGEDAIKSIKSNIVAVYNENRFLIEESFLNATEQKQFEAVQMDMSDVIASKALRFLCDYLSRYYGKKVIILLDEYDTPMQEAYLGGYWDDFMIFIRSLFNATFKTNPYLERALMTGITRVSKESVFSDLNNLKVITTTSAAYSTCFGFTEEEVFASLDEAGLSDQKENVKEWYDGFTFGTHKDIYNPWSITNFLDEGELKAYWASTSSNGLVDRLIRTSSGDIKEKMEQLLQGEEIIVNFDEQIIFDQLEKDENSIWSLLLASGYLRADEVDYRGIIREPWFHLRITNLETLSMFIGMFKGWFGRSLSDYRGFMKSLLQGDIKAMNHYMNQVALTTFSYFDTGKQLSGKNEPERFYHGFVLGLIAEQGNDYLIRSNRESGFGRYDVMMIPKDIDNADFPAIVMEFKVHDPKDEISLEDTVSVALEQIRDKEYDRELHSLGIPSENIYHYGFAFEGKRVLIG